MHHPCHRHCRRGSALLETAAIFLTFFALLLAIIDFGQVLFLHQTLSERARAAARWGVGRPFDNTTLTTMQNIVLYNSPITGVDIGSANPVFGLKRQNVTVEQAPGFGGAPARLSVHVRQYGFRFLAPYLAGKWTGRDISITLPSESAD